MAFLLLAVTQASSFWTACPKLVSVWRHQVVLRPKFSSLMAIQGPKTSIFLGQALVCALMRCKGNLTRPTPAWMCNLRTATLIATLWAHSNFLVSSAKIKSMTGAKFSCSSKLKSGTSSTNSMPRNSNGLQKKTLCSLSLPLRKTACALSSISRNSVSRTKFSSWKTGKFARRRRLTSADSTLSCCSGTRRKSGSARKSFGATKAASRTGKLRSGSENYKSPPSSTKFPIKTCSAFSSGGASKKTLTPFQMPVPLLAPSSTQGKRKQSVPTLIKTENMQNEERKKENEKKKPRNMHTRYLLICLLVFLFIYLCNLFIYWFIHLFIHSFNHSIKSFIFLSY